MTEPTSPPKMRSEPTPCSLPLTGRIRYTHLHINRFTRYFRDVTLRHVAHGISPQRRFTNAVSPRLPAASCAGPCQAPSDSAKRGWKGVQMGKVAGNLHVDIDKRLRALQKELDRISHTSNPGINSSVLHVAPQHFPTSSLRLELEAEMDRLLREQVRVCILGARQSVSSNTLDYGTHDGLLHVAGCPTGATTRAKKYVLG